MARRSGRPPPRWRCRSGFANPPHMRTADQPIRISLIAPEGRMGKAIATAMVDSPEFTIDQDHGDVLLDFSAPDALQGSLDRAIAANVPILVGTTGLNELAGQRIAKASEQVAV